MPWNNQNGGGGGPWGGGGGTPGGGGPPRGPWGQGPQGGGGGGGGGNQTPDLEELIRRSQERLKSILPGGGGNIGFKGAGAIAVIALFGWLLTGVYQVPNNEVGVNLVLGRHVGNSGPGLNWNWPAPIGRVERVQVTNVRRTEVGFRSAAGPRGNRDVLEESLMLTGDENIVDIDMEVQWEVNPGGVVDFAFNLQNPEGTVKSVAESSLREAVGRRNIQPILTTDQAALAQEVQTLMQKVLDDYRSGVLVRVVQLVSVQPPGPVRNAFLDVNAAQQDQSRVQNEARTYASQVVPEARGQAARVLQEAEAYRDRVVAEANGQASRFRQVYEEYRRAPGVTRERMFLETMERILSGTDKIIIDQPGGQGVQPFLPLDQLQRRPTTGQPQGTQR